MKGKLIIIESGSDACGKATQTARLYERLKGENYNIKKVEYPNYKSDSSALVKMYLNGDFGSNPDDVNAYAASTFYAVDRYASYKKEWKSFYDDGAIILADRYTTSNMVYQAAKIDDKDEKEKFLDWLWNFEFNLYGIPEPDCVFFLDMPPEVSHKLLEERAKKVESLKRDIHESNYDYLVHSYKNALYVAEKYNWIKINCVKDGMLKPIDEIHEEIYRRVKNIL